MNNIKVHHQISTTQKEIYEFEKCGNTYVYVGIYYSNRDNSKDKWGDNWRDKKAENKALDEYAQKRGYKNYDDLCDHYEYVQYTEHWAYISEIEDQFNPICNKTIHGEIRYHGCHWGHGSADKKYKPKMSVDDIKAAILKQTRKIKIEL